MQIWSYWLSMLQDLLELYSSTFGLGAGAAILLLTVTLRAVLLPISWTSAYRGCIHQKKFRKLQPELQMIREKFRESPSQLSQETLTLYRKRGVALLEGRAVLGALLQMPVLLGVFQVLRSSAESVRFFWISSLARPDVAMAILAGITTAIMMAANPEIPEQTRMIMILLPSVIAFVFALKFASALALYWVASNLITALQTSAVHYVVGRRIRSGRIAI